MNNSNYYSNYNAELDALDDILGIDDGLKPYRAIAKEVESEDLYNGLTDIAFN